MRTQYRRTRVETVSVINQMEQDDSSGDRSGQSGYSLKVEPRGFPQLLDVGYERKSRVKYDSWV